MKIELRDVEALRRLSLIDVRAYLLAQHWVESGLYGNVATVFRNVDRNGREQELLLPRQEQVADYASRMADIVAVVSEVEERPQLAVYNDLLKSGFDVIRFRALHADEAGTIDLDRGVALYDHARELVAAAANAAVKPKRAYRGAHAAQAKGYLESLRLGQTEVGSYVLTVLSPVAPTLEQEEPELFPELVPASDPFSRTVTRTLVSALERTKQAAIEAAATGRLDPFERAVECGVSANLCDAIAKLVEQGEGADISVSWSVVRPAPATRVRHSFGREDARVLSEAAAAFRDKEPEPDTTIEGFVIALQREPSEFDGRAKIRGFVGNQIRTLAAEFSYGDYRRVTEAHDRKLRVRVDGEVVRRGPFYLLQNARNLIVMDDDDDGGR